MYQAESATAHRPEKYRLLKYLRFKQFVLGLNLAVGLTWLFSWINGAPGQSVVSAIIIVSLAAQAAAIAIYGLILRKGAVTGFGIIELGIGWLMWPLRTGSETLIFWLVIIFIALGALTVGLSQPNRSARPDTLVKTIFVVIFGLVIWLAGWVGLAIMSSTVYPLKEVVASNLAQTIVKQKGPSAYTAIEVRSIVNPAGRLYLVRIDQAVWIFDRNGLSIPGDGPGGECRLPIDWSQAYRHEAPRWCAYLWSSPLFHRDYQTIPNDA